MKTNNTKEWRILLNPAFCGEILRNSIKQYENHKPEGLPITLVFFVLPLVLHPDTASKIRNAIEGQFFGWLDRNFLNTINFEERVKMLKKVTLDALALLSYFNAVEIKEGRIKTIDFDFSLNSQKYNTYMPRYQDKAIQVGRWFSQSNSISTIYLMLGVRP
ncbi:MAG: hypothetical protein KGZ37_02290 [Nitrosarchaeum sp.]|nr:hypothetical protein [Nitrosarchaeum sp.]